MTRRRFTAALIGAAAFVVLILVAATADGLGPLPGWWRYRYDDVLPLHDGGRPTLQLDPGEPGFGLGLHPLGQDSAGHDYLALVLRGLERSLTVCLVATAVALLLGTTIGVASGYLRGWVDAVLSRATEVALTMPLVVIAVVLGRYSQRLAELWAVDPVVLLGVSIGSLTWMTMARVVRVESMRLRSGGFVEASVVLGAGTWFVVTRHVLPNLTGPVLAASALIAGNSVLLESALSYLGFGVVEPDASLGQLVEAHQGGIGSRSWLPVVPGALIVLLVLAVHTVSEGLSPLAEARARTRVRGPAPR